MTIKLTVFKVPPGYKHQPGTTPALPIDWCRTHAAIDTIRRRNDEAWATLEYEIKRALHILPPGFASPAKPDRYPGGFTGQRMKRGAKLCDGRRATT